MKNSLPVKVLFAVNLLTFAFYVSVWRTNENVLERDFIALYTGAQLPFEQLYEIDAQRRVQRSVLGHEFPNDGGVLPFVYTPFIVPLLKLICSDDYVKSYYRWRMLLLLVTIGNGFLLFLILWRFRWHKSEAITAAFSALMFPAVYSSIVKGQFSALMVAGILFCVLALQRSRNRLGGAALGATLIKPHMTLPIFVSLLRSRPFTALWLALTGSALAVVSFCLIGLDGAIRFFKLDSIIGSGRIGAAQSDMVNLLGLMFRLGVAPLPARIIAWTTYGMSLLILGVTRKKNPLTGLGIALVCAVFFAPHVHFHDLYLLLPAMALAANALREKGYNMAICLLLFAPLSLIYLLAVPTLVFVLMAVLGVVLLGGNTRYTLRPTTRIRESP